MYHNQALSTSFIDEMNETHNNVFLLKKNETIEDLEKIIIKEVSSFVF